MKFKLHIFLILIFVCGVMAYSQSLPQPANLTVKTGMMGGAVLQWDTASGNNGYMVYKSVDGSSFGRIASVKRNCFIDLWIFPDHLYKYFVTSFVLNNMMVEESIPSDTVLYALGMHHLPLPGEGVIGGKIIDDQTGHPLKDAVVRFFNPHRLWFEKTHTDSGGIYWAAIDTGHYLVRADKFDYVGEWFDNSLHVDSASVVTVCEDSLAVANFALHHTPILPPVTVGGRVIDSASGLPLQNTFVAFLRPHKWLRELQIVTGLFGGFPFERISIPGLGNLCGVVWFGKTDVDGNYTAHLAKGVKYIALAFKPGYVPQFYNNKLTPFDADCLRFESDSSGIDFNLIVNPVAVNSIYGSVIDSSGTGIPSNVILYRKTILGRVPVRFAVTDSVGSFAFHSLVSGVFYVKAFPIDVYAPAWYSSQDCGVRNWRFADTIRVIGDVNNIDVCVGTVPRIGFSRIAGNINRNGRNLYAVAPEQGVAVYAVSTATNQVMGYDVTEDDGTYSLENLPEGSYSIVLDKEGLAAANTPVVTVDASNNYESSNVTLIVNQELTSVDGNIKSVPSVYKLYQNYPNPFNPETEIRFDVPKASQVSVKIYNLIGQKVVTLVEETLEGGEHSVKWNARDAGSGIYFVKLIAKSVDGNELLFSQVRKMILVK